MLDDLFAMIDPPAGAIARLRATLQRRAQRRRRRRAALRAAIVVTAVVSTTWLPRDPVPPQPAFDVSLHPALALVDDAVLPPVAVRGSASLLRRPTLDPDVLLYELGP